MKTFVITGPESTGKSTLARKLKEFYDCTLVDEYARSFINQLDRPYQYHDLLTIAKGQWKLFQQSAKTNPNILICDTSLLTIKVWSEDKFGKCDPWIEQYITKENIFMYILCDIDVPWVYDDQREDAHRREELKYLYLEELKRLNTNYTILSGSYESRLQTAVEIIDQNIDR